MVVETTAEGASIQALTAAQAYEQADAIYRLYDAQSPEEVLTTRQRLLSLARHSGDAALMADALLWGHQGLLFFCRYAEAQAAREESRAIAERLNAPAQLAACDLLDAQACCSKGLYVDAVTKLKDAVPRFAGHRNAALMRQKALSTLCNVYIPLRLWDEAIATAAQAAQLADARGHEAAGLRARYDDLYSRLSRAEERFAGIAAAPEDDADLRHVESAARAFVETFAPAERSRTAADHAHACKEMLFQVLVLTGRRSEAAAMWHANAHIDDPRSEPVGRAEIAFHLEGPQPALDLLTQVIDDADALTAENRARGWWIMSKAHEQLGDHRAALRALREHMKLELGQSQTSAKVQAALLAHELEAEREKLLSQRALIHAGKLAAVGQLASSMAHEVAQPSAALMLLGADAREALQGQRWVLLGEVLGDMEQQTERLSRLVNSMKAFSRDDPLHMQTLSLRDVVEEAHRLCRPAIGAAKVACVQDLPDLQVHADKERVILTLVNLVNNALDAMRGQTEPAPELRIEAAPHGGPSPRVRLSVIDNGPGLSEDALAHISQSFFTTKSTGLGLGLTITREALAGMGARLEIGNGPRGGACISVLLPAAPPA